MVKLYILSISKIKQIPENKCYELFPLRMEKADRYKFQEDRLRCIGAGLLLHGLLGIHENEVLYGEYGKPFLPESSSLSSTLLQSGKTPEQRPALLPALASPNIHIHFNLSHSGEYVVLSISEQIIGVDIENTNRKFFSTTERILTAEEITWLREASPEKFFLLWTMKEGVCKALGTGLSLPFSSFSVLPLIEGKTIKVQGRTFQGKFYLQSDYYISIVGEACEPADIEWIDDPVYSFFTHSR